MHGINHGWQGAIAILAISLTSIPTAAHAQLETCIGPEDMENNNFSTQNGPVVTIDYWSEAEQNFIVDYQAQFFTRCMGLPPMSTADLRSGLYHRDSYNALIAQARSVCKNRNASNGTPWERFVTSLNSFLVLCQGD